MNWILRDVDDTAVVRRLQHQLRDLPEPLARALAVRGITSFEAARHYFRASLTDLHDPFLMKGMEAAASRLLRAIRDSECVLVHGDYDADGVAATAILVRFLGSLGARTHYFIPSRFEDGYGLHARGIERAAELGATLMVAVDCGINALREAELARRRNVDLVICDHHTPGPEEPAAAAILNPKRTDCPYPCKHLAAGGVVFKLVQALQRARDLPAAEANEYLDLTAIATMCDVVPLVGENRILVREGLAALRHGRRPGLQALAEIAGCDLRALDGRDMGYRLGPRINAAGRMEDASRAVELLLSEQDTDATRLAQHLDDLNSERKKCGEHVLREAMSMAEDRWQTAPQPALVLHRPDWHQGVLGIAAGRIKDRFQRPAILLSTTRGEITGSARSVPGIDIQHAIARCRDLLTRFGGHAAAAGLTLPEQNLDAFRARLNEVIGGDSAPDSMAGSLSFDAPLDLASVDSRFVRVLRQFGPFGNRNEEPVFHSRDLRLTYRPRTVGASGAHLKISLRACGNSGTFDAIGFSLGAKANALDAARDHGQFVEALFSVQENTYRGRTRLQLRLSDIRPQSGT